MFWEIFNVSYLFLYLAKNLQCLFSIVYKVVYRSELVNQNINFYISLHTTADFTSSVVCDVWQMECYADTIAVGKDMCADNTI